MDARPICRYKGFEVYPFIYLSDPPREWHGRRSDRFYNASMLICQADEEPNMEDSRIFRLEATPWDSVGVAKRVAVKMAGGIIDGFVSGQTLMAQQPHEDGCLWVDGHHVRRERTAQSSSVAMATGKTMHAAGGRMVRMRYSVGLRYEVHDSTVDFIFNLHAAQTVRQVAVAEPSQLNPALMAESHTESGLLNRRLCVHAPRGHFSVTYTVTVGASHVLTLAEQLFEVSIAKLPPDVITSLAPNRYCESDRLMEFALRESDGYKRGYRLVITIRDWVCRYVRRVPQSTNERTSAVDALVKRKGVYRDYAHLMIALCCALSIPARFCSSLDYGADPGMGPADFHAFAEVFVGQHWYLIDPPNAAVSMGFLRIGTGRNVADIPTAMVFGNVAPSRSLVQIEAVASIAPGFSMPVDIAQGISTR